MSDVFGLHLYYHVFTPDGDVMVSDNSAGDRVLVRLAHQYPTATATVNDRDTGKALTEPTSLKELLRAKSELLTIAPAKQAREDAA